MNLAKRFPVRKAVRFVAKFLTFVGCFVGFSLQIDFIYNLYNSSPYDVLLISKRTSDIEFPSVTICTDFWINTKSPRCVAEPTLCSWQGQHVTVGVFRVQFDPGMARSMAHEAQDIFKCVMKSLVAECPSFDCSNHMGRTMFWPSARYCYTMDNYMYSSSIHPFHKCKKQWMYELQLTNQWTNETVAIMESTLMPIFVQRPSTAVPEQLAQIYLEPGKVYTLNMRQAVAKRLQRPYRSNCTNYDAVGVDTDTFGFALREACTQNCMKRIEKANCGCVVCHLHQYHSKEDKCCAMAQSIMCVEKIRFKFGNCSRDCSPACRDYYYDVRTSGIRDKLNENGTIDRNSYTVNLRFRSDSVEYTIEQPSLNLFEVSGYVGGFLGSWLGISLLHFLFQAQVSVVEFKNVFLGLFDRFAGRIFRSKRELRQEHQRQRVLARSIEISTT